MYLNIILLLPDYTYLLGFITTSELYDDIDDLHTQNSQILPNQKQIFDNKYFSPTQFTVDNILNSYSTTRLTRTLQT